MELAIILLIVCEIVTLLVLGSFASIFYDRCEKLKLENMDLKNEAEKTKKSKEDLLSIDVGNHAIYPNYTLTWVKTNESFKVTYEVEILEVSTDCVKVNALSYTTNDTLANSPNEKQGILSWMKDKWVSKNKIEMIVDDSKRRDSLIDEILDK